MFLFYVLSFFKKGVTNQGGTLFKEMQYVIYLNVVLGAWMQKIDE